MSLSCSTEPAHRAVAAHCCSALVRPRSSSVHASPSSARSSSSVNLTLGLLTAATAATDAAGALGGTRGAHRSSRQAGVDQTPRHLQCSVQTACRCCPSCSATPSSQRHAPDWFVTLVRPATVEYRHRIGVPDGPFTEIAIRPNPADEISEAWERSRTDLLFLLSFAALAMLLISWTVSRAFRPVAHILAALDVIQHGDYSARLSEQHLPELQQIARKLNRMSQQLESQEQENRALAQPRARRPGGGTQGAWRSNCTTNWARRSARSRRSPCPSDSARPAKRTRANEPLPSSSICDGMHAAVRNMSKRLRPVVLDELGLVTALRRAVEEWIEHHPGVACTLEIGGELGDLDEQLRIQVCTVSCRKR